MNDVCGLCGFPVMLVDGRWTHSIAADGVFCALVMAPAARAVSDG